MILFSESLVHIHVAIIYIYIMILFSESLVHIHVAIICIYI